MPPKWGTCIPSVPLSIGFIDDAGAPRPQFLTNKTPRPIEAPLQAAPSGPTLYGREPKAKPKAEKAVRVPKTPPALEPKPDMPSAMPAPKTVRPPVAPTTQPAAPCPDCVKAKKRGLSACRLHWRGSVQRGVKA